MIKKVSVAILDDHPMILQGVENILSATENMTLTGAYQNGESLLEGFRHRLPDLLLLDIQMPEKSGDEWISDILNHWPDMKIIAFTNIDHLLYVYNMLKLGARGYLLKSVHPQYLIDNILLVAENNIVVDHTLQARYQEYKRNLKRETYLSPKLTDREIEVVQLIVDGFSSKQIAGHLSISIRTVEYYRLNILLKLDVNNTAALVKKALLYGLAK